MTTLRLTDEEFRRANAMSRSIRDIQRSVFETDPGYRRQSMRYARIRSKARKAPPIPCANCRICDTCMKRIQCHLTACTIGIPIPAADTTTERKMSKTRRKTKK